VYIYIDIYVNKYTHTTHLHGDAAEREKDHERDGAKNLTTPEAKKRRRSRQFGDGIVFDKGAR